MTALATKDLRIGYGDVVVCGPISLSVEPGEILVVVGPNGAGKSTFLRTIVGILEPLEGGIRVLGDPLDERSSRFRAGVATVFDDDAFFPALTVAEHLRLVTAGHRVSNAADAIEGVLDVFGVGDLSDRFPSSLSSGQRRRFLLASAFVRPRSLLVLDEPEQRLDLAMRRRLVELLRDEREQGGSVILACHDTEMIRSVADRALLILADNSTAIVSADDAARALES